MPGPDINEYSLAMALSISEGPALAAVSRLGTKIGTVEKSLAKLGKSWTMALSAEVAATEVAPKIAKLNIKAGIEIDPDSKAALDKSLTANIAGVVRKGLRAGLTAILRPVDLGVKINAAAKKKAAGDVEAAIQEGTTKPAKIALDTGTARVTLQEALRDVKAKIDGTDAKKQMDDFSKTPFTVVGRIDETVPLELQKFLKSQKLEAPVDLETSKLKKAATSVSVSVDKVSKSALDKTLYENISNVMAGAITKGVSVGQEGIDFETLLMYLDAASKSVAGIYKKFTGATKVDADSVVADIQERFAKIGTLRAKLELATPETAAKALQDYRDLMNQFFEDARRGNELLVPWAAVRKELNALSHDQMRLVDSVKNYASKLGDVERTLSDMQSGYVEQTSMNIEYHLRELEIFEKEYNEMRKLQAQGIEIGREEEERMEKLAKFFLKKSEENKKDKAFWEQEYKHAKAMEAHRDRMRKAGELLRDVEQQGIWAPLIIQSILHVDTALKVVKTSFAGLKAAGLATFNGLKTAAGWFKNELNKPVSVAWMETKAHLASLWAGFKGIVARMFGMGVAHRKAYDAGAAAAGAGSKLTKTLTKPFTEVGRVAEKEGASIKKATEGVKPPSGMTQAATGFKTLGGAIKEFFMSIMKVPWAAIGKFAVMAAIFVVVAGAMVLLAYAAVKLGVGFGALAGVAVAMIGFAIAMKILGAALVSFAAAAVGGAAGILALAAIGGVIAVVALSFALLSLSVGKMFDSLAAAAMAGPAIVGMMLGVASGMWALAGSMLFTAWAIPALLGLGIALSLIGDASTKIGADAGARLESLAQGLRSLGEAKIGLGFALSAMFASQGIVALGVAAAFAGPPMAVMAQAGSSINEMVGSVLEKEADFDKAAGIVEHFGARVNAAFKKVSVLAMFAGMLGAKTEAKTETVATVKVSEDITKKTAESSRLTNANLKAMKDTIESITGKLDPATVKRILDLLDEHLPVIAGGANAVPSAPVDPINRWKNG